MGFLDDLFNGNPTREWRAQAGLGLVLDLDDESFCGIRLGERADRLQRLGPAEDARAARGRQYRYLTRGFECREELERFVECALIFAATGVTPFAGVVRRHGAAAALSPHSTEQELVALVGPPDNRTAEEAEDGFPAGVILEWHFHRTDCTAELSGGELGLIWLGTKV